MPIPAQGLGGRLPLLDPATLSNAQRALYDRMCKTVVPLAKAAGFKSQDDQGHLIGPFNPALFNPDMGSSFLALQKVEEEHTSLTARARQVVILSVGSVWRAPYELYAHTAAATKTGLSPDQIEALIEGRTAEGLTKAEIAAHRFTRHLVRDHVLDDETYAAAQAAFGDTGLVEMVVLIGCYLSVCAQLNAFAVPVPDVDQGAKRHAISHSDFGIASNSRSDDENFTESVAIGARRLGRRITLRFFFTVIRTPVSITDSIA